MRPRHGCAIGAEHRQNILVLEIKKKYLSLPVSNFKFIRSMTFDEAYRRCWFDRLTEATNMVAIV